MNGKDRARRGEFLIYRPGRLHNVNPPFAVRAASLVFAGGLRTFHHRTVTPEAIKEALKQVKYPGFSRDIVS